MAKYRIKIEPIDPTTEELTADERLGIECEGFALIMDRGDKGGTVVRNMSILDIADSLADESTLLSAACIARGMAEGEQLTGQQSRHCQKAGATSPGESCGFQPGAAAASAGSSRATAKRQARPAGAHPLDASPALPPLPLCGVAAVRSRSSGGACKLKAQSVLSRIFGASGREE